MFIYNVTTKVDWAIHEEWLRWMIETNIPRMLDSGYFTGHQLLRLREIDDSEGPTYALTYQLNQLDNYYRYLNEQSAVDNAYAYALWNDRCVSFATLLEVVQ